MTGTLFTQSYRFNPNDGDGVFHWQPEESCPRKRKYAYNEELSVYDNSVILSAHVVELLKSSYSILKMDPCPMAVPVWGDGFIGAEVFYHNKFGTMKISARVGI